MKNVLWITVDSMRTSPSEADDRGIIPFFEKFKANAVCFSNCYCSAPSTVMSVSSMMTAVPAVYHSTCYDHFDKNSVGFESLPIWFESIGYQAKSVVFFPEGRQHLTHLMGDTLRRHWPKGKASLFWSNKDIYSVFSAALNEVDPQKPCFFYVHFNLRHDPRTNEWVEKCYETFKSQFEDAIILLTSDHGYPDPKRGIKRREMVYHGHDLLLTDDNVCVPLAIEGLPGQQKNQVRNKLVSLIDIAPTIQRAVVPEISHTLNDEFFDAGVDLLSSDRRTLEVYNRYIFQNNLKIKFVIDGRKLILSDGAFEVEEDFNTCLYEPTDTEVDHISSKMSGINVHFQKFINRKARSLPAGSIIYCSRPTGFFREFFNFAVANDVCVTDKITDIDPTRPIFICRSSENIFQTINDYRTVRSVVGKKGSIRGISLNFDVIPLQKSKIRAVAYLFFKKFIPRFVKSPSHTILEVLVVLKRI